jgi:hypothetical protein
MQNELLVAIAAILKLFLVLELQIKMQDDFLTDGIAALQVAEFARFAKVQR